MKLSNGAYLKYPLDSPQQTQSKDNLEIINSNKGWRKRKGEKYK